jgi:hypothetical protein
MYDMQTDSVEQRSRHVRQAEQTSTVDMSGRRGGQVNVMQGSRQMFRQVEKLT